MKTSAFSSAREAKEFLVAKIVEEAQREGVALSEVERKMLYFTESGWTLPDIMDVSAKFDEEYDQAEYETKIAKLIKHAVKRTEKENPEEYKGWLAAVERLSKEDHYILAMTELGGIGGFRTNSDWQLWPWVVGLMLVMGLGSAIMNHYGFPSGSRHGNAGGSYNLKADKIFGYLWLAIAVLGFVYLVLPAAIRIAVNTQLMRAFGILVRRKQK
jgi:hypothetical protein